MKKNVKVANTLVIFRGSCVMRYESILYNLWEAGQRWGLKTENLLLHLRTPG